MAKRTGKFYRNNEAEVMKRYGLNPTKNSGSGWIEKEDGENDKLICQLKSTDADSIKINLLDIHKLIYHAQVSHKIPFFMVQFLSYNEEYILVKAEDIQEVASKLQEDSQYKFISKQEVSATSILVQSGTSDKKVKSSSKKARSKFYLDKEKMYNGKYKNKG